MRQIFSISAILIAVALTVTHSAIAAAEAYKTSKGEVVVTGLTPTTRYQIRFVNAQGKPGSRQDKSVNSCGEIVIERAANYTTLVVGSETIDPAALETKTHVKCKPVRNGKVVQPSGVVRARTPEAR
ncbi:hypothetical protein C7B64_08320 [Merismopedia glauca CCAP 1448/3]|uniref:Uncharacterized protein n=1 Tax=Merismopedia glauca CCAP 1448/3 TaxID=1296344 RepID=A0A2T1C5D7_9CYAN|nr:hypothetical protein C7B64_08320 [Merismopedia glauca CCAP 1448/3]